MLTAISHDPTNKLLIAAFLGFLIGLEREISGKDPSLRTFALICLGSCIFAILSISIPSASGVISADPARISAQIVVGIGFLGAGTIYRSRNGVSGLTTAALMWCTAAIGTAVGSGRADLAVPATIIAIVISFGLKAVHRMIWYVRSMKEEDKE